MDNTALYATTESFLSRIDPRVKILAIFGFVAVIASLSSLTVLAMAAALMLCLALAAGIGLTLLARRLLWVLPFGGVMVVLFPFVMPGEIIFNLALGPFALAATREGLDHAAVLALRVLTAVLSLNVLLFTTGFRNLMTALGELKVPLVLIRIIEFTVRYIYVLADELNRMRIARKARGFRAGRSLFDLNTYKTLGLMLGVLFVRSWERGERIHQAMLARGFSGESNFPGGKEFKTADLCWGLTILATAAGLWVMESGFWQWQISLLK